MSDTRAAVFYCPYCGEETLRPYEEPHPRGAPPPVHPPDRSSNHGAWECRSCTRVFVVKLTGMVVNA